MLTEDLLKKNEALSGLTDDQIKAIVKLSKNDEEAVIGSKIGEIHGQYEQDCLLVTGIKKEKGEKAYDYWKRAAKEFVDKAGSADETIKKLQEKTQELEEKIKEGSGDDQLKQKLADTTSQLEGLKAEYQAAIDEKKELETNFKNKLHSYKFDTEVSKVLGSLKFKPEYPQEIVSELVNSVKKSILEGGTPEWQEIDGKEILRFRDKNGELLKNKAKGLDPYTLQDLLTDNPLMKNIIDGGRKKEGAGSKGGQAGPTLTIGDAKTQLEADTIIRKALLEQGLTTGSQEYSDKMKEIRIENNVSSLPFE